MIVIPDASAIALLDVLLDGVDTWIHLYVLPVTLGPTTTLKSFTEASWPDYAAIHVTSWSPALPLPPLVVAQADPVLWVRGTGGVPSQVYGYFVTNAKAGPLLWAEASLSGPVPMVAPTDQVLLLPAATFRADPGPCS